jgi:hypothetical protein
MMRNLRLSEGGWTQRIDWRGCDGASGGGTPFVDDVAIDGDAAVGANCGAQSAAGAIVIWVEQDHGPVSLVVQFFGQSQNILGTGTATQLTPFAPFYIDHNSSSCHLITSGGWEIGPGVPSGNE